MDLVHAAQRGIVASVDPLAEKYVEGKVTCSARADDHSPPKKLGLGRTTGCNFVWRPLRFGGKKALVCTGPCLTQNLFSPICENSLFIPLTIQQPPPPPK